MTRVPVIWDSWCSKSSRKPFLTVYDGAAEDMVGRYVRAWNRDQRTWKEGNIERTQKFRPLYRINIRRKGVPMLSDIYLHSKSLTSKAGFAEGDLFEDWLLEADPNGMVDPRDFLARVVISHLMPEVNRRVGREVETKVHAALNPIRLADSEDPDALPPVTVRPKEAALTAILVGMKAGMMAAAR